MLNPEIRALCSRITLESNASVCEALVVELTRVLNEHAAKKAQFEYLRQQQSLAQATREKQMIG